MRKQLAKLQLAYDLLLEGEDMYQAWIEGGRDNLPTVIDTTMYDLRDRIRRARKLLEDLVDD